MNNEGEKPPKEEKEEKEKQKEEEKINYYLNKYQKSVTEYIRRRQTESNETNNRLRIIVYAYADDFTFFLIKYLLKFDDILSQSIQQFSNENYLLGQIKKKNEENNMYTEDKPNFATQIALILNPEKFKRIFTQDNIVLLLSIFEQCGFTGIYGYKDSRKRNDSIDLHLYYPEVVAVMIRENYPFLKTDTILHKITNIFTHDFFSGKKKIHTDISRKSENLLSKKNPEFFNSVFNTDIHTRVSRGIREIRRDRRYNPYGRGKIKKETKKNK